MNKVFLYILRLAFAGVGIIGVATSKSSGIKLLSFTVIIGVIFQLIAQIIDTNPVIVIYAAGIPLGILGVAACIVAPEDMNDTPKLLMIPILALLGFLFGFLIPCLFSPSSDDGIY